MFIFAARLDGPHVFTRNVVTSVRRHGSTRLEQAAPVGGQDLKSRHLEKVQIKAAMDEILELWADQQETKAPSSPLKISATCRTVWASNYPVTGLEEAPAEHHR
ncbi:hypothetical protein GCM10010339_33670 [Streptomyces alanosinicus]|uniref:Uncharacterized protein n=1 Tax=Streptomyces alanosinicus TaxID=68171 RepID=A0A918YHF9_9ACTN|nr:hypothetical protein GCM10010339_33670 [Streptomyces alanosinicus]